MIGGSRPVNHYAARSSAEANKSAFMAKILPFTMGERGPKKKGEVTCEIVIFPGVRVEYNDRPTAPAGNGRPRRRRRTQAKDVALA